MISTTSGRRAVSTGGSRAPPPSVASSPGTPWFSTVIVCLGYRARSMPSRRNGYASVGDRNRRLGAGDTSPAVRESPNATKRVKRSSGGGRTSTVKLQLALRLSASVAVQVTGVVPIGKAFVAGTEQVTGTGGDPPCAAGIWKLPFTGKPSGDWVEMSVGHV